MEYAQPGGGTVTLARWPAGAALPAVRPARVVLADDAQLMHLAIRSMLSGIPWCALAAAAGTVTMAEQLIRRIRPEVLICDTEIGGKSGIGLCTWTQSASPGTAVVILTSRDDPLLTRSALEAGARGYLLKTSPPEALLCYLQQAAAGRQVLDDRLGQSGPARPASAIGQFGLSRREREVFGEVLAGLDNRAIAMTLCISEDTVKSHVKAIFRKLGARDRTHAVALALGTAAPLPQPPAPRREVTR